jgi:Metal binding domain of Ada
MKTWTAFASYALACSLVVSSVALAQTAPPSKPSAPATPSVPGAGTPAPPTSHMKGMKPTVVTPVGEVSDGKIHGNKKSLVYHLPSCPSYGKLSAKNIVSFATEDEAVKAGYHKAKNCK